MKSRAIAAALMLLWLVSPALTTQSVSAQALRTIRVVGPPNDGYKAVYYGVQSGIFRKYGLDVQPTLVPNGSAAAAALIGGSADIAFTNLLAVVQAHLRGVAMQLVAGGVLVTSNPSFTSTLVLKDSPIQAAKDLNGKIVGLPSVRDLNAAAVLAWTDQNGGDSKSIRQIEVTGALAVPMLDDKRVDAVTLNEPAVGQALATGKVRILMHPMDAIGKRVETAAFVGMASEIEHNRDAMTRFARAMHEAQAYTNNHLSQTVKIVSGYSGVAAEDVARSVRVTDAEYVDARDLQPVIDILAKYGFIDRAFPANEIISSVALRPHP